MQRVYAAANLPEAHLIVGLLRGAGIAARVLNESAQGALGELPFSEAYPEVWIEDERDHAIATRLIRDYEGRRLDVANVRCAGCGEENPGNFDICWHCGASL